MDSGALWRRHIAPEPATLWTRVWRSICERVGPKSTRTVRAEAHTSSVALGVHVIRHKVVQKHMQGAMNRRREILHYTSLLMMLLQLMEAEIELFEPCDDVLRPRRWT